MPIFTLPYIVRGALYEDLTYYALSFYFHSPSVKAFIYFRTSLFQPPIDLCVYLDTGWCQRLFIVISAKFEK